MSSKHSFDSLGDSGENFYDLRNKEDVGGTLVTIKTLQHAEINTASKDQAPTKVAPPTPTKILGNILLPLPKNDIQFNDNITYGDTARWLQGLFGKAGDLQQTLASLPASLKSTIDGSGDSELTPTSPSKRLRYQEHNRNNMSLSFDLISKNADNSSDIYNVIRALRYFSLPYVDGLEAGKKWSLLNAAGTMQAFSVVREPCVFDVGFVLGDDISAQSSRTIYLPFLEDSVLKAVDETLSMSLLINGASSNTTLSLQFEEILQRHANFYESDSGTIFGGMIAPTSSTSRFQNYS